MIWVECIQHVTCNIKVSIKLLFECTAFVMVFDSLFDWVFYRSECLLFICTFYNLTNDLKIILNMGKFCLWESIIQIFLMQFKNTRILCTSIIESLKLKNKINEIRLVKMLPEKKNLINLMLCFYVKFLCTTGFFRFRPPFEEVSVNCFLEGLFLD